MFTELKHTCATKHEACSPKKIDDNIDTGCCCTPPTPPPAQNRSVQRKHGVCSPKRIDDNVDTGRYYTPPPTPAQNRSVQRNMKCVRRKKSMITYTPDVITPPPPHPPPPTYHNTKNRKNAGPVFGP